MRFDSATTLDPFNVSRDVKAVFAEVRIPVFGQDQKISGFNLLEVGAAVRKEIYSDTSDPTVPKVSLRWLPIDDQLAIRATYSKSFAAPTLFDLFGPGGVGFTGSLNLQRFGGGPNITGQANARSGANPGLLPSNSKAYTFGAVWSPKAIKGFSVTVDYFNIEQTDLVSSIGVTNILQSVELEGAASPFASFVRQGPVSDNTRFTQGTPITAPGQIGSRPIDESYVTDTLVNISGQKLSGIDFKAQYTYSHDTWGRFDTGASVGYYKSYTIQSLPTTAPFETVGTTIQGTIPRWRSYSFVDWKRGNWGATLAWEFIPSVDDAFADPAETDPASDVHVGSFSSFDTSIRYRFGSENKWLNGFEVRVGANNVLNRQPPLAPSTFTSDNADTATYGAIGRLIFIEARYRF